MKLWMPTYPVKVRQVAKKSGSLRGFDLPEEPIGWEEILLVLS